jgi:hypothetical protein
MPFCYIAFITATFGILNELLECVLDILPCCFTFTYMHKSLIADHVLASCVAIGAVKMLAIVIFTPSLHYMYVNMQQAVM